MAWRSNAQSLVSHYPFAMQFPPLVVSKAPARPTCTLPMFASAPRVHCFLLSHPLTCLTSPFPSACPHSPSPALFYLLALSPCASSLQPSRTPLPPCLPPPYLLCLHPPYLSFPHLFALSSATCLSSPPSPCSMGMNMPGMLPPLGRLATLPGARLLTRLFVAPTDTMGCRQRVWQG